MNARPATTTELAWFDVGYRAGRSSSVDVDELHAAGYGDPDQYAAWGSTFTHVPPAPPGPDDLQTDWAAGYAMGLDELATRDAAR